MSREEENALDIHAGILARDIKKWDGDRHNTIIEFLPCSDNWTHPLSKFKILQKPRWWLFVAVDGQWKYGIRQGGFSNNSPYWILEGDAWSKKDIDDLTEKTMELLDG